VYRSFTNSRLGFGISVGGSPMSTPFSIRLIGKLVSMHSNLEPRAEPAERQAVTRLLNKLSGGDRAAFDQLIPLVYEHLRKLAMGCLRAERPDHTLRATALVHEAYLRMVDAGGTWQDRLHFYAVAARVMRHILVDHARTGNRKKRGSGASHVSLDDAVVVGPASGPGISELDDAMKRLAVHDARKSQVVELLFFGGLTYDETAAVLGISAATVHRELRMAKAWLQRDLSGEPA
jgi:RNA polymerase sigma factor (TIGR02999 family)